MSAPAVLPCLHALRIVPDPNAPPEARAPGAVTRLERIALAQERTAEALERIAERLDHAVCRMDADAAEFQAMVARGRNLVPA